MNSTTESDRQTSVSIMKAATAKAAGKSFKENKWGKRHVRCWDDAAMFAGTDRAKLPEALTLMIRAWVCYADAHRAAYENGITDDGFLGPAWASIGGRLRELLNGDLGTLDGGTLDSILCGVLENEGIEV